jgi:hypothetical protein
MDPKLSVPLSLNGENLALPPGRINNMQLLQGDVKYLRLHLDRRRTWHKHIFTKQKQLGIALTKVFWLLGAKPKLPIYKSVFKLIWTYGLKLWSTACSSN